MRTAVVSLLMLLAVLSSCASRQQLYGNFLGDDSEHAQSFLALDCATQLRRDYAPASLPLVVPDARDPFGQALVTRLRRMGFSVTEEAEAATRSAVTVRYVVSGTEFDLYRVTLRISRSHDAVFLGGLNRVYSRHNGVVSPAGPWTRLLPADQAAENGGSTWTTN